MYNRTRCTSERGVQHNEVFNRTRCTTERGVQQNQMYNRTRCTTERDFQLNEVFNRTRCITERGVQQNEMFNRTNSDSFSSRHSHVILLALVPCGGGRPQTQTLVFIMRAADRETKWWMWNAALVSCKLLKSCTQSERMSCGETGFEIAWHTVREIRRKKGNCVR